jgi:predicted chitinase
MIKTLVSVDQFLPLESLNRFQIFELQTQLNITVPQIKLDCNGKLDANTLKSYFIYKERNKLNFPTSISFQTVKHLQYSILESNPLDVSTDSLLVYFTNMLPDKDIVVYWTASFISLANHFNITDKSDLAIFLSTLAYESNSFKHLYKFEFGGTKPCKNEFLKYQPKGLIKFKTREEYIQYTQHSNGLVDIYTNPNYLLNQAVSIYFSCLYWKIHNLSKYAQELNFRSVVKHFDCMYNTWSERYYLWQDILKYLY